MFSQEFDADFFRYSLDASAGWPMAGDYAMGPDYGQAVGLGKQGAPLKRIYGPRTNADGQTTYVLKNYVETRTVFLPVQKTGPDRAVYKSTGQDIAVIHDADTVHTAWHDAVKAFAESLRPVKKHRGPKIGAKGRQEQKRDAKKDHGAAQADTGLVTSMAQAVQMFEEISNPNRGGSYPATARATISPGM